MSMGSSSRSSTPKARRSTRTRMSICEPKRRRPTARWSFRRAVTNWRSEEPSSQLADWDHPVYFAARDFAIEKNEDTVLEEIVCTLSNIKVTLTCSKDLADQFTAETISTISLGETPMVFVKGETRAAYFTSLAELNTLKFNLTGAFADTPETPLQFNKEIPNVKAGQWRKITLVITYADKGGIKFDIDVKNFIMDEEIRIDGTANVWEPVFEEGPDPLAPAIEWPGHDLTEPFRITSSMFDADGKCTEPFALNLTAPNGIESLVRTLSRRFRFPIRSTSAPPRRAPPMRFSRASGFRWATSSAARPPNSSTLRDRFRCSTPIPGSKAPTPSPAR